MVCFSFRQKEQTLGEGWYLTSVVFLGSFHWSKDWKSFFNSGFFPHLWGFGGGVFLPELFLFCFLSGDQPTLTNSTFFQARIGPQSLSKLRWLWPSVSWQVACELMFPDRFPLLCRDSIASPLRRCWVTGVCVFRCNLPPALLADWLGSFTCLCGNMGWNRCQIRVSTESKLWKRKFSHCSCWDSNLQPFDHESGTLPTSYPSSPLFNTVFEQGFTNFRLFYAIMILWL